MATAFLTCLVSSTTWCFCTACSSLLSSCCGNDKPSTLAPSVTSGRKRSVLLLVVAIGLALSFQYAVAPAIIETYASSIQLVLPYLYNAWMDGCTDSSYSIELTKACVGNNGVYRPMFAATVFFLLAAVAAYCKPTANREAWPAKYVLYLFGVAAMVFIPSTPLFNPIYLNIARIGGVVFIFVQQLVIIDMAYNWNDSWVEKANQAEQDEGPGSGKKWLVAILLSCIVLFALSIGGLVYLFIEFTGCPTNDAFISVTLIFCIAITVAQLSDDNGEGSLLSSACVSAWAVYLLYSAVTKNPNADCNPMLGIPTIANIILGLIVSAISLGYTGWSYTAHEMLAPSSSSAATTTTTADNNNHSNSVLNSYQNSGANDTKKVAGVVVATGNHESGDGDNNNDDDDDESNNNNNSSSPSSWRINVVLAAICCWTAVVLTHWGSVASKGSVANPSAGSVAMWMVIASQWVALALYLWTLVAPRLFPDREFS